MDCVEGPGEKSKLRVILLKEALRARLFHPPQLALSASHQTRFAVSSFSGAYCLLMMSRSWRGGLDLGGVGGGSDLPSPPQILKTT